MNIQNQEKRNRLIKAGEITARALLFGEEIVVKDQEKNLFEICDKIERKIIELGAVPSFPCNIDVNELAAHFSPLTEKDGVLPDEGVIKIDAGARIEGEIVDAAISIALSSNYEDLVNTTKETLDEAIKNVFPDQHTGEIGKIIQNYAEKRQYKTIRNLSGHLITEYSLHSGKSIPNIDMPFSPKMKKDEIYAIEPFLTDKEGDGVVVNGKEITIYSLNKLKRPKINLESKLYDAIFSRCRMLPFSPRWLADLMPLEKVIENLEIMRSKKLLYGYPTLIERSGKPVAQFEHTMIVTEEGCDVLTKI